jgi:hypothetical protein
MKDDLLDNNNFKFGSLVRKKNNRNETYIHEGMHSIQTFALKKPLITEIFGAQGFLFFENVRYCVLFFELNKHVKQSKKQLRKII